MKNYRYFFTFAIMLISYQLIGQTLHQVGNLSLIEQNGLFFQLYNNDTIKISPDAVLVKFKGGITPTAKTSFASNNGLTFINSTSSGVSLYTLNQGANFIRVVQSLNSSTMLEYFDLNYFYEFLSPNWPPNPMLPNNDIDCFSWDPWHLYEDLFWPYLETELFDAWNLNTGSPEIIVANLDNGIFLEHYDLGDGHDGYSNIWTNSKEIPGNNIDDDNNGYVDDYYGWNFTTYYVNWGDNDVSHSIPQEYTHGSMTGSIIAAKTNNGPTYNEFGVFGVAGGWGNRGVRLMNIKVGISHYTLAASIPFAIEYACQNGAKVVNMPFGGAYSQAVESEISYWNSRGVVFVAAVGNNDSPYGITYPANYDEVISVGATQFKSNSEYRWFGYNNDYNWGSNFLENACAVDIMAPCSPMSISAIGQDDFFWNTIDFYGNSNISSASTSAACSFVSGVVALMLSADPCLTPDEIRLILRETADKLTGETEYEMYNYNSIPGAFGCSDKMGYGRINAKSALESIITNRPIIISGVVEPWTNDTSIFHNITIEQNGVLEINNCEISFAPEIKIIIHEGGTLIVNNSVLTGLCDATWQGIEVWGNSSANQWPDANGKYQQGRVDLDNATIENAVCALNLWEPDNYSKTGGIVNATGSLFRNNAKSVHALHFRNFHPINETEVKYNSAFTDCVFEITEDYPGIHTFYKHVDMSHVNGIRFIGCDFTLSPLADGIDKYNMAISSYNSAFSVEARCITAHMGSCDYDRSSFEGFYRGIYAHKSSGSYTFTVNRADFTGNTIGVMVNGVEKQSILFCNFRIGPNYSDDGNCNTSGAPSYGISMIQSNGFIIEENDFRKNVGAPQGLYIGIRCKDGKSEADVIYRNSFTGLSYGNYADGQNRNRPFDDLNGLSFMCNNNQNNDIDFIVAKKDVNDNPMINSSQGSINLEAKNTFSANPLQYGHFRNDGGQVITYFYNTNPPIYYTPRLVVPVFVTAVNNCPSNYGGNDPKPLVFNENQRQERETDFAANLSNYHSVKLLFDNLEDGGNTQNLKSEIDAAWPKDMWDLRAKLLGLSPYLSEEVLMATADKTDVLPESVLFEILSANPDELKKETLIEYLENKENPLPEYLISILRQLAGGITYKTVLMQDMAKYEAEKANAANDLIRSCLNDDETDMNYLRTWYNNLNSLNADYGIVDTYLTEKNFDAAASMLEVIPSTRNLFGDELNEFLEYRNLVQWQIQKHQQVSDITNIDSTDFDMLLAIAQNGSIRASSQAMAILEYGTGYHFNNCLYESIPGSNKNISVENPGKDIGLSISANPNPANSWVAFGYKLPLYVNSGEISVTDMQGRLLASFRVTGNAGQKVWDIRNIQKGVYLYTLKAGNRSKQGKLVIQ